MLKGHPNAAGGAKAASTSPQREWPLWSIHVALAVVMLSNGVYHVLAKRALAEGLNNGVYHVLAKRALAEGVHALVFCVYRDAIALLALLPAAALAERQGRGGGGRAAAAAGVCAPPCAYIGALCWMRGERGLGWDGWVGVCEVRAGSRSLSALHLSWHSLSGMGWLGDGCKKSSGCRQGEESVWERHAGKEGREKRGVSDLNHESHLGMCASFNPSDLNLPSPLCSALLAWLCRSQHHLMSPKLLLPFFLLGLTGLDSLNLQQWRDQVRLVGLALCVGGAVLMAVFRGPLLLGEGGEQQHGDTALLQQQAALPPGVEGAGGGAGDGGVGGGGEGWVAPGSVGAWSMGVVSLVGNCMSMAAYLTIQATSIAYGTREHALIPFPLRAPLATCVEVLLSHSWLPYVSTLPHSSPLPSSPYAYATCISAPSPHPVPVLRRFPAPVTVTAMAYVVGALLMLLIALLSSPPSWIITGWPLVAVVFALSDMVGLTSPHPTCCACLHFGRKSRPFFFLF
ncbi:unnamed protein product [Closterium sp. Naga37s-1]|nr:unnamed protein product [Closterium sp. Naga37s-1]